LEGTGVQNTFKRSFNELDGIVSMTEAFFLQAGISPDLRHVVDLAIEELFVNMVTYNTETTKPIEIGMQAHGRGIEVSLTDSDVERFNPTTLRYVDTDAPVEERKPGGLGLFLVLKMVDSINYQYRNRQSRISFTVDGKQANV
jgi:serine/threonine-protein kinase RsbW